MQHPVKKHLERRRDDWFSPGRKMNELRYWRKRKQTGLTHGITDHEMRQWDALERVHGLRGLFTSSKSSESVTFLRDAPKPVIQIQPYRGTGDSPLGCMARIKGVLDPLGFVITEPSCLTGTEQWVYHVVKYLTIFCTLCTHPDMAHLFWPATLKKLPDSKIIDVMVSRINKKIFPERIQNIPGRGYKFIPAA